MTPSTRVANGFICLFNKTTELELKQTETPKERRMLDRVLTITPCKTSPFLTFDVILFFDRICCTDTTMTSPTLP